MKPEAQQIAIAEACGWISQSDEFYHDKLAWRHPSIKRLWATQDLPDYPNSLDAMHEAEKTLNSMQRAKYALELGDKFAKPVGPAWDDGLTDAVFSTAAARAEAFLKTLNFWQES